MHYITFLHIDILLYNSVEPSSFGQEAYDRVRSRMGSASIFPTIDEKALELGTTDAKCNRFFMFLLS